MRERKAYRINGNKKTSSLTEPARTSPNRTSENYLAQRHYQLRREAGASAFISQPL
ncbi:hypothetical protein CUZ93_0933 [Enterococcus xinjiangensis]|nr:hypothetical protein [Enterococcus lactis]